MEKKPYHHLSDGTFRNPEGSPERNSNFKWSFRTYNKEKKKIDMTVPKDHVVEKTKVLSDLERFKHDDYETKIFDKSKKLKFYTPSRIASYRAHTFFSKEKDTLEWIEKYGDKNKVFFDIGANIGVYTLFYAATHNSKVYSFEPSFRNLDLLVRNIVLNTEAVLKNINEFQN